MDVQQELFTATRQILVELFGEDNVFDGCLPPKGTPYPFAYLADALENESPLKGASQGDVTQTVHVFHDNIRERGNLSVWLYQIKQRAKQLDSVEGHSMLFAGAYTRIIPDRTTESPLLHGVIELSYQYT